MSFEPADLWDHYGGLTYGDLPAEVRQVAQHCVADWFGCALAGCEEPAARLLREEFATVTGPCSLVGQGGETTASCAALINGTAGHALDYDDTSTIMGGHPTGPVLPAALALAQAHNASGQALLTALVVGAEVEARLGWIAGMEPYKRGWHTTATMGVFGAAASAAHLLGLDEVRFRRALGIAASQAAGVKANFGTMTKPLHVGQAAERGLLAARLAARGFTAGAEAFTGRQGLLEAMGADRSDTDGREPLASDRWAIRETLFKHHAACHLAHAAIEATQILRQQLGGELQQARVTVNPAVLDVCAVAVPTSGLECKFSLAGVIAMAWLGLDTSDPGLFTDDVAQRGDIRTLLQLVEVQSDENMALTAARVEAQTQDGNEARQEYDVGVPAQDLDVQQARIQAKFRRLAAPVMGDRLDVLDDCIWSLADMDYVRQLMELAAGERAA